MSIAHGQLRTFEKQLGRLRAHIGGEADLAALIEAELRAERSAGSRDRKLYRELHYTYLRFLPRLQSLAGDELGCELARLCSETPATHTFRRTFLSHAVDAPVVVPTADLLPPWLHDECPEAFAPAELAALHRRAPLWARVAPGRQESVISELGALGWACSQSSLLPTALRVDGEHDLTRTDSHAKGHVEVQDLGSQLILASQPVGTGGRWFDACAGAGGKTLQLATLLGQEGVIEASDIRLHALEQLLLRAIRAGLRLEGHAMVPRLARGSLRELPAKLPSPAQDLTAALVRIVRAGSGLYDGVLVDAPCSGSGTWRRSPHLKWSTTPASITAAAEVQFGLLCANAALVRSGGLLVYATCSLCTSENERVIARFLSARPEFSVVPSAMPHAGLPGTQGHGLRILPHQHDTDGFYVCSLRRA